MQFEAPAKINLNLRILEKREDGFHELETLMVPVPGLFDTLSFEAADSYKLTCSEPLVPVDESNLVTQAVRVFEEVSGKPCGFHIHLEKRIPHGAGLGGGSSDAATALLALNELEDTRFSNAQLAEMAGRFGSDTAFFVFQQPCVCRGRGEIVEPVSIELGSSLLLLKPSFPVSTPAAFRGWKDSKEIPGVFYGVQTVAAVDVYNDLERPVFEKHVFLAHCKDWLRGQDSVRAAGMSGSGSTLFALVDSERSGTELLDRARAELDPTLWGFVGTF